MAGESRQVLRRHATRESDDVRDERPERVLATRLDSVFDAGWRTAEPVIPEGEDPPFTRRMVQVARLPSALPGRGRSARVRHD